MNLAAKIALLVMGWFLAQGRKAGMPDDPQRGRAGFAERRSVGQLYSRAKS